MLLSSIIANFSVENIGFNNSATTINYIRRLFTVNRTASFNVSSILVDPIAFNITLQARIYSFYGPESILTSKTFTL
jgi:hypothetical protein